MTYADYEFYLTVYRGSAEEDEIREYLYRAQDYIDSVTFGRITEDVYAEYGEPIGKACCACAEVLRSQDRRTDLITQEKVGNYSVSYSSNTAMSARDIERKKYGVVKMYLSDIHINGVGLMYRGAL